MDFNIIFLSHDPLLVNPIEETESSFQLNRKNNSIIGFCAIVIITISSLILYLVFIETSKPSSTSTSTESTESKTPCKYHIIKCFDFSFIVLFTYSNIRSQLFSN